MYIVVKTTLSARERMLEVIHILQEQTDSEAMLTIHEIYSQVSEKYKVTAKSIREDILALEESSAFPVVSFQIGRAHV